MVIYNNYDQVKMDIYDQTVKKSHGPVKCLGIKFDGDTERRKYFIDILREKLKDPEFRRIEGFPIGEDEDILALSDPPYYTACPNPWIEDFIEEWEKLKPEKPEEYLYSREPFTADVSEGKNHPVYNAHSYHTKVPHKAIMRYILHYTEPNDIVLDGFCGTGMTGVAAQLCGDKNSVLELGYQIKPDGTILQKEQNDEGNKIWKPFSQLGERRVLLNDLSPAASFISYNYNAPVFNNEFEGEAKKALEIVEKEYGWMYETLHTDGKTKGKIIYCLWSDVFVCPDCSSEVVFWDSAVDTDNAEVRDIFNCQNCNSKLSKNNAEHAHVTLYDSALNLTISQSKQLPVLIIYSVPGQKGRFEKIPDISDIKLINDIDRMSISDWYPCNELPDGYNTRQPKRSHGFEHVNHFYTKRNLIVLAKLFQMAKTSRFKFLFTGFISGATRLNQFHLKNYVFGGGGINPGPRKGTLYVPSISMEVPIVSLCKDRLQTQIKANESIAIKTLENTVISTGSFHQIVKSTEREFIDYIFIDPPFGANLNYSELSYIWESWLKVFTNNKHEAIENPIQKKGSNEYRFLMTICFKQAYKLLKPGHWMTVEFSNTKASVWNSIQVALGEAGFIVANVSALDKKQGGINANISKTAVKQDLVISAYKPSRGFENRFQNEALSSEGIWDFIRTHMSYLPVIKKVGDFVQMISDRDPRILFDQMVSYYVRNGFMVPISSQEFRTALDHRFVERDGMYFLPEQAAEYDKKKMGSNQLVQMDLVMSDESTAIDWLRHLLREKPLTFAEINSQFMSKLGGWSKYEANLDLRELLTQNFILYDGKGPVPEQIHTYLSTNWHEFRNLSKEDSSLVAKAKDRWYIPDPNKAGDLEKLRERSLLKEFDQYKSVSKKLKQFRLEAVRTGFKKAWQDRDYATIVSVAEKIPSDVLEEDPKLLMWYDQAMTRLGR